MTDNATACSFPWQTLVLDQTLHQTIYTAGREGGRRKGRKESGLIMLEHIMY